MPFVLSGRKWGDPTRGTGATVNWSFADNRGLDTSLAQQFQDYPVFDVTINGSFRDLVRADFRLWSQLTGINFVEVADSTSSQVRVGQSFIDGPGGDAAIAREWFTTTGTTNQATIQFDNETFDNPNGFYLVGLHEVGHVLGLAHSPSPADLMFGTVQNQTGLSVDDIRGARTLYNSGVTLEGTSAPDVLNGGTADDLIYGYEGGDTINGLGGNDIVIGGRDANDGPDSLVLADGNDLVFGNGGADTIAGGGGSNTLVGGFGADTILAGSGNDAIYANQDNDVINAGDGNNVIVAGLGNDSIVTGAGVDTLIGSEGDDTMAGGGGADIYKFFTGSGNDQINGFSGSAEGDRLDLEGQTFTTGISADGDVVLQLSGGGTIELNGIAPAAFSPTFVLGVAA